MPNDIETLDEFPNRDHKAHTRSQKRILAADRAPLAGVISTAVRSGEAWALTNDSSLIQKYLPTLRAVSDLVSGSNHMGARRDLTSRILKSFSGSPDDGFIKARLNDTRRRYYLSLANIEPLKGFDAMVACLVDAGFQDLVRDLDEQEACRVLATTVAHGASAEDRFIRNVLLRLRSAQLR